MRKYKNYNDNDLINAIKKSKSLANVLKILDLRQAGGNFATIKKQISKLNLDISHFKGQGWNKGDRLKDWASYKKANKTQLIKERGHKCEKCLTSVWLDAIIPLEIHHIDGNRTNNLPDNLQLLCCNCHALTDNWRNKKRSL